MQQQDWDALRDQMGRPFGTMRLQCDQFVVDLQQALDSKSRKWVTAVYVDGYFKGTWANATPDGEPQHEEARRFMRKVVRRLHSAKDIAEYQKIMGKREARKLAAKVFVYYLPDWSSFNRLKKHLVDNNTSIERIH